MDEVNRRYAGLWVIGRITERDAAGQPKRIEVVATGDRYRTKDKLSNLEDALVFLAGSSVAGCSVIL
jgi:hypothetical protein